MESEPDDLQPYYRLVELQKEMMELVKQNAEAERKCVVLRQIVARDAEAMFLSRRGLRHRFHSSAAKIVARLFRRASRKTDPAANGWLPRDNGKRNRLSVAVDGTDLRVPADPPNRRSRPD